VMAARHARCPPWLHGPERAEFLGVQARYDRMLKVEGFRDLESGADLAAAGSSMLGGGGPGALARDAEFWRRVQAVAADLPRNYRGRRFVVAVATGGNLSAAARAHGLTPMRARWMFKRFLEAHGLGSSRPARSTYSGDGRWRSRRRDG
jgi:hypothetical protein